MEDTHVDLLFDVRHIRQSGIGTYISAQLPCLEEIFAQRKLSLGIVADEDTVPSVRPSTNVFFSRPRDAPMYSMGEQLAWNDALRIARPRAIWVPHYPFPFARLRFRNRRIQTFVTVHDTLHIQDSSINGQTWVRHLYARSMLRIDARACRTIFTPSVATADSLSEFAPVARVMVTPIPVDAAWFNPTRPNLTSVEGSYILYVGNVMWHKNLRVLLKAYGEIAERVPQKLVIAGGGRIVRNRDVDIDKLAERLGDRVQVIGRLEFEALRALVADADLLVMPSLHEGAGLPPLEAMASTTAVVASNIPALRETCGDAAEYFDPYDAQALGRLLEAYCSDADARDRLATRGLSHVRERQSTISAFAAAEAVAAELGTSRG